MPIFSTLMPYIKERKKGNASKFYIAFLFDGDELTKDNMSGGAEDFMHHLPKGGEGENDGAASSRSCLVDYQLHFQQLRASGVYILKYVMGSKPKLCL